MLSLKLFSTPVRIHWLFGLVAVGLGYLWSQGTTGADMIVRIGLGAVIVLTGVLVHEFGHAIAGRMFGLVPQIELRGFMGATSWVNGRRLKPLESVWVSFAGPLTGIVIGGVALAGIYFTAAATGAKPFAGGVQPLGMYALETITWVNLGWGVLNLIPMQPLDGGHIMASFAELAAGNKGRLAARWISLGVAALLIAFAVFTQEFILGVIVFWLAAENWNALRVEREIGDDMPQVAEVQSLQAALDRGEPAAFDRVETIASSVKSEAVRWQLLHVAAIAALRVHDADRAERLLSLLPAGRPADPAARGLVLAERGRFEEALPLLEESYQRGVTAVEQPLAQAYAETGRFDRAAEVLASRARTASSGTLAALERAAYEAGAYEASAFMGAREFERGGSAERAYNVACSYAKGGHDEEALAWLEKAAKAGFRRADVLDQDDDLAALRSRAEWPALRARFG